MRFVQDAVPGNEDAGFSEALVGVDGEWRGIQVKAMPKEKQVIDFEPTEQRRDSLPGTGENAVDAEMQAFQDDIESRATDNGQRPPEQTPAETDGGETGGDDDA